MAADWEACRDSLYETANAFRLGMEGAGSEKLVLFIDCLMKVLQNTPSQDIVRLNSLLQEIFSAQARRDFLRIADLLEYTNILPPNRGESLGRDVH